MTDPGSGYDAERLRPHPPEPTHQEYKPGEPAQEGEASLFGPGLKPWVSMAEALGWGSGRFGFPRRDDPGTSPDGYRERDWRNTDEPAGVVTEKARSFLYEADPAAITVEVNRSEGSGGRRARGGDEPSPTIRGGAGGGCGTNLEITLRNGTHEHRAERDAGEPAPMMHFGERLNTVTWAGDVEFVANQQAKAARRSGDEPAPTIKGGHDTADRQWVVTDTGNTRGGTRPEGRTRSADDPAVVITSRADQLERRRYDSRGQSDGRTGERIPARQRGDDEPAPTIAGESRNDSWTTGRPATTMAGNPRVFPPGHKLNADDVAAGRDAQRRSGAGSTDSTNRDAAVRVTVEEASVLQSFPVSWPWQGTRTAQFQQIGNAVPPLMARRVLEAVSGR